MAVMQNKKHKTAVTIDTATATYNLTDFVKDGETVNGLALNQIWFSSNGTWTVARGANTIAVLSNSGHWNLAGHNCPITKDDTATLVLTLSVGSVGSVMVEVRKVRAATDYV